MAFHRFSALPERKRLFALLAGLIAAAAAAIFLFHKPAAIPPRDNHSRGQDLTSGPIQIELTESQAAALKAEKAVFREFSQEKQAVGAIDFNQNRLVSVFTPYQGRIISALLNVGDAVEKDQVLFTIDSPDLLTAESNLISAAGALLLQSRTLNRTKSLLKIGGISQQQVDQTTADQQAAEGALKAARDAVRIFGKSSEEIDKIVADRLADPRLVVKSPLTGTVTARAAVPGQLVQPGVAPAPFVVADTSTMWMVANAVESDAAALHVGQEVKANISAYPGRSFDGKITVLGPSVDPITRRLFVRSEIADPEHLLRAGMFANFVIRIGDPIRALALPQAAVVREGDGSMICWVTENFRRFTRRIVVTGQRQGDFVQIISGLDAGETVVGEGAVFLSNQAAVEMSH
ncbi:efflux RND transporter periplasmic adaptor subunit [Methylocystis sp. IM3]|jgi:cobalt-zinc-cadmium efflux system membrane fusion protein|uniref:efflux RND transporter periplasmic adaptor subunit n=1 Tax=unclassified Methylocystis TaxID=2625913 RepID=UPI000F99F130|nr:MAG: efflux RND transporter periplasmic adaptor subunit [Hyphomicrobiales bacterium]